MKKQNQSYYIIPESITPLDLLQRLQSAFKIDKGAQSIEQLTLTDSFEWALYSARLLAFKTRDQQLKIWSEDELFDPDQALLLPALEEHKSQALKYWWQFKEQSAIDLKSLLNLRALMDITAGELSIQDLDLQNEQGKTQVFAQHIIFSRPEQEPLHWLKLESLTGYEKEFARVAAILEQAEAFISNLTPLQSFLSALGQTPLVYSVKPELQISSTMPARQVANQIISQMLHKQRQTEQGIIEDIDTEFLHHFRVALRMNRAAIAQLKEVYPVQLVEDLKQRFAALARETNQLRDLDVFILDKNRYRDLLPSSLSAGLIPMFEDFGATRIKELQRVGAWLESPEYHAEMEDLQALFNHAPAVRETAWSEKPAAQLASYKIIRRFKKIRKAALAIHHQTEDEYIHNIRIDCKKLRYLLQFFGSLYQNSLFKWATRQLKSLQDTLGNFNDYSVQEDFLYHYLEKIEQQKQKDIQLIAALGGLITIMHKLKLDEREQCIAELHKFSAKENQKLFMKTFSYREV